MEIPGPAHLPRSETAPAKIREQAATSPESVEASETSPFTALLAEVRERETTPPGSDPHDPGGLAFLTATPPQQPAAMPRPAGDGNAAVKPPAGGAPGSPVNATVSEPHGPGGALQSGSTSAVDAGSGAAFAQLMMPELSATDLPGSTPAQTPAPAPATVMPALATTPATANAMQTTTTAAMVQPPLQSPVWPVAFSSAVRILASEGVQIARLQITPEDLGPIDVRITVADQRTEIAFAVTSPEARAAIQQALPQLQEALLEAGLQFGGAAFSDAGHGGGDGDGTPAPERTAEAVPVQRTPAGLIDLYA